jgi:hypothetical protein
LADASKEAPKPDVVKTVKLNEGDKWTMIWMVFVQLLFVTMAYE